MKVLFVETRLEGHRTVYLKSLCSGNYESVALLPAECKELSCKQRVYEKNDYCVSRSVGGYLAWIKEIKDVAEQEHCDVIHFLCGDELYRFFGLRLGILGKKKVIVTFHHMIFSSARKLSYRFIFSKINCGVVHTEFLAERLYAVNIKNVSKIEYPCFNSAYLPDAAEAKKALGIPSGKPCLLALGGVVRYKGLDFLLDALNCVKEPFTLCIAGQPYDFSEEYIRDKIKGYEENTVLILHRLSDLEYEQASVAADVIVLPYRKEFDGASGPMIDAVWHRRPIIGAAHGSMGDVIKKHSLGVTFESESADKLAEAVSYALAGGLSWNESAERFRAELTPERFLASYEALYRQA